MNDSVAGRLASGAHPRLLTGLPVLELRDGTVQIGCDADRGLRFGAGPTGLGRMLADLTGEYSLDDLTVRWNVTPGLVDNLVTTLARAGLLAVDDPQEGPLGGTRVARVVADTLLVPGLVAGLLEAGVGMVQVVAPGGYQDLGPGHDRVHCVDMLDRRPLPAGTPTVVASGCLEPDPALIEALMRADDPHVVLRPRPEGVLVGPFVVPGRTSCLTCGDLTRAARDASWVEQRAAMISSPAPYPPALREWATSMVMAQLSCWGRGGLPDLADRTVEMDTRAWRQTWRAWRPHPSCGCCWAPAGSPSGSRHAQTASVPARVPSSSTRPGSAQILSTASP
ncbi:TOMM precursor leader peptide-binding protein [Raineyella fluvialis]|uniref:TOMM leader peptide-binding protein n=1 Tax=Raineyella fluvialis TaxID=2662261 RepID=A0A5Q2FC04_9ACTN|nr:TOMM precursor leader peptide-binding protein [Raineyella fluvialis]QGF24422.1 TOMM precursor leader peptide-binding protein [Raineyella fluvialis]